MASWIGWKTATNPLYEELVGEWSRVPLCRKEMTMMLTMGFTEKATSPLNLAETEDIALNLEICDLIRSKQVQPKPAMQSLKTRIGSKNGRVQMSSMSLTDTCIKNGGDHFLQEIASKEFVDEMVGVIKAQATQPPVREMALRLFQQWALAFESKRELSYLPEMYRELKNSGIAFPPPPAAIPSHLLTTATPPTWVDSDSCMRCRTAFSFTNRKHHCRNCGCVFDQACSSKTMPLPALGIKDPVRVCEGCYAKRAPPAPPVPNKRTPRSAQDMDADLQRAIALSLAESQPGGSSYVPSQPGRKLEGTDEDDDEQLRLAIEASLREMSNVRPTAPGEPEAEPELRPLPTYDLTPREMETMLAFTQTIDHAVGFGDQDLRRFPHAHALHDQARMLTGKLQRNVDEKATKHQMLSEMHDRLMQTVQRYNGVLSEQDAYQQQQREARSRQTQSWGYPQAMPPGAYGAPPQPQQQYGWAPQAGPSTYQHLPPQNYYAPPPAHPQEPYHAQSSPYPQAPAASSPYARPETSSAYASAPSAPPRSSSMYGVSPAPSEPPALPRSNSMNQGATREHIYGSTAASGLPVSPVGARASLPPMSASPERRQGVPAPEQHYPALPTQALPNQQYPSAPSQATSFPAFPDAPAHQLPEQQMKPQEQPKEALLIEL